jgi:acetyltransferase-like isoleucine patch superfamily enzyme
MQSIKYIIGKKDLIESITSEWLQLETGDLLVPIEIEFKQNAGFDFIKIHQLSAVNNTAFIAWGGELMNFQRLELFMELKKKGFKLPPLICRNSFIAKGVEIGENTFIGSFAKVLNTSVIGFNSYIMSNVIVESNVKVGNSCFIESGSILKNGSTLGDHIVIKTPTFINESVSIGTHCYLDSLMRIDNDIQEQMYFSKTINAKIFK